MGIAAWIPNIKENSWTGFKMLPTTLPFDVATVFNDYVCFYSFSLTYYCICK